MCQVRLIPVTAKRFGVSRSALDRHKKHLPSKLVQIHAGLEAAATSSILSQVQDLKSEFRGIASKALSARNYPAATAALREVRNCLEFQAKAEIVTQQNS